MFAISVAKPDRRFNFYDFYKFGFLRLPKLLGVVFFLAIAPRSRSPPAKAP
ncbi:hypothetical protein [Microcoleus sp. herbarium12]|uniref:hypothetical protein n=1 Tax=Microcoleus sp. herbarium12 TaxID=3055437 RepID=UPI002FD58B04